mgnify:CR=1 FL=1
MKQEEFIDKAKEASKEMLKKKAPMRADTQFMKGALWAWELLKEEHDYIYFEEMLRRDVADREGKVDAWKESLIHETAVMMADREGMERDILSNGRLITKYTKDYQPYKESNPLYIHLKELQRSIGMQREHLGLSNKVNPTRMRESPKTADPEKDTLMSTLLEIKQ